MSITHFVGMTMMFKSKVMRFLIFVCVFFFADSEGLKASEKPKPMMQAALPDRMSAIANTEFPSSSGGSMGRHGSQNGHVTGNETLPSHPKENEKASWDEEFLGDAHREVNHLNSYVAFGVLIALFYMRNHKNKFMPKHCCLSMFSGVFAMLSLVTNYGVTWWQRSFASQPRKQSEWALLNSQGDVCFFFTAAFLVISLLCMLCLTYRYFYKENEWGEPKEETGVSRKKKGH